MAYSSWRSESGIGGCAKAGQVASATAAKHVKGKILELFTVILAFTLMRVHAVPHFGVEAYPVRWRAWQ